MTTIDFVFQNLPFLVKPPTLPNDEQLVNDYIMQSRIELQKDLKKTDLEVFDETAYNFQEKMIVALYSSINLLIVEAIKNVGGSESSTPNNKILSRAKADVTEAQWTIPKASDGNMIILGVDSMVQAFMKRLCALARQCELQLQICSDPNSDGITGGFMPWGFTCSLTDC